MRQGDRTRRKQAADMAGDLKCFAAVTKLSAYELYAKLARQTPGSSPIGLVELVAVGGRN